LPVVLVENKKWKRAEHHPVFQVGGFGYGFIKTLRRNFNVNNVCIILENLFIGIFFVSN